MRNKLLILLALCLPVALVALVVSPPAAAQRVSDLDRLDIVNTVADLSTARVLDGGKVETLGYTTVGDGGGNIYYYDADGTQTIDGGFVLPGKGGTLSFSGTTFNGTAGTGRYIAVDQAIANMKKFGAIPGDGLDDSDVLRRAQDSDAPTVFWPAGVYDHTSWVDLKSGIKYCGDGMGRTIIRRNGATLRRIFAIATNDFENGNESTFVQHAEDIEISDMTLDWYFVGGWVDYAGLIQFKGSDTGNSDRIEDITIRRVSFIDSAGAAHGTNDAWAINVSAAATSQKRLLIEDCKQLAEHHQFIAGGGIGWEDVTYRNNYVYHPQANGITASTVTDSAVFKRVTIEGNTIVGPYGLGIWVGPDQVSEGGTNTYEDIFIRNNHIVLDSYSVGGTTAGARVNCSEGITRRVVIENNTVTKTADFGGSVENAVIVENEPGQVLATSADYTQPAVGASVTVSLVSIGADTPTGIKVMITGGGLYSLDAISGTDVDLTLLANAPAAATSTVISSGPSGAVVETFGTIEDVTVKGNTAPGCRISIDGVDRCAVHGNSNAIIELLGISTDNDVKGNTIDKVSVNGYQTGFVVGNSFRQFNDSGSLGNIRINVNSYRGLAGTDAQIYDGNRLTSRGGTTIQNRFIYEVTGAGNYLGRFYNNIASTTLSSSFVIENDATRIGHGNVYQDANFDGAMASISNARYYTESLDFDLTSVEKHTISFTATGVSAGDLVLMGVPTSSQPDGGLVNYTVLTKNNLILVTATRSESTASNPGSGTFQFVTFSPR